MKNYILLSLALFSLVFGLTPILKASLKEGEDCSKVFKGYLTTQDFLIATKNGNYFNRFGDTMGGISMICDNENKNVELFYIYKKGRFDSEVEFLSQFLFDKFIEGDKKIRQNLINEIGFINDKDNLKSSDIDNNNINGKTGDPLGQRKEEKSPKVEMKKTDDSLSMQQQDKKNDEQVKQEKNDFSLVNPSNVQPARTQLSEAIKPIGNLRPQQENIVEKVENFFINTNKISIKEKELFEETLSKNIVYDQNSLNYELHIFLPKSPCIKCLNAYENLVKNVKRLKIHVYYSIDFRYNNEGILQDKTIQSFSIYGRCLNKVRKQVSSKIINKENNNIQFSSIEQSKMLNCLSTETLREIQEETIENLFFHQIDLHSKYSERIKFILRTLYLAN